MLGVWGQSFHCPNPSVFRTQSPHTEKSPQTAVSGQKVNTQRKAHKRYSFRSESPHKEKGPQTVQFPDRKSTQRKARKRQFPDRRSTHRERPANGTVSGLGPQTSVSGSRRAWRRRLRELSNIVHHPYQSVQCVHAWRDFAQQSYERLLSVSSQCELLALHNGTYTAQFSASERGNLAWRVEGSAISVLTLGNKVILYCIVYPLRASRMQVGMSDCSFYTLVLIICLFLFEYPSKWSTYTAVSLLHS